MLSLAGDEERRLAKKLEPGDARIGSGDELVRMGTRLRQRKRPVVCNWSQDTWCAARDRMSALPFGVTWTEGCSEGEEGESGP